MNKKAKTGMLIFIGLFTATVFLSGCDKWISREKPLNDRQQWALATTAIPKMANHMELDVMGGGEASEDYVKAMREMLKEDWEITDHNSAIAAIDSLKKHGLREQFDHILEQVSSLDENDFSHLLKRYDAEPETQKQLRLIYAQKDTLRKKSIIGWDYCRLIYVAECSYRAGYFSEDEAWKEIMPAAKVLQATFSSWRDMGDNYLLGREFWSGNKEPRMVVASKFLLTDRKSPWLKYDWKMPLDQDVVK